MVPESPPQAPPEAKRAAGAENLKHETRNTGLRPLPNAETRNTAKHETAGKSETRNTEAGETPLGGEMAAEVVGAAGMKSFCEVAQIQF